MKERGTKKDLCSFLEEKLLLFDRYLSITERMKKTFKDKEAGHLGTFLSKRQDCIERIGRIDSSIENIIEASSKKLNNDSGKFNGVIGNRLEKLKGIMETVNLMDGELMGVVKEEGEGLKRDLLKMRNVRQAARGYKKAVTCTPRFLDTRR